MNVLLAYPAHERRLILPRCSPDFFSGRTTQQMQSISWPLELGRAAIALTGIAAWGLAILLFVG